MSARRLCQVIDLLAACHSLVPLCMLHLHLLSILLRDHFDIRVNQLTKLIPLSSPVVQSCMYLVFWSQRKLVSQEVPLQPPALSHHVLTTGASNYGWVVVCSPWRPMMEVALPQTLSCQLFTQSLLALWSDISTSCVVSVHCEFIFTIRHVAGVQTDLFLFTGMRLILHSKTTMVI